MGNPLYYGGILNAYYSIFCDVLMLIALIYFIVRSSKVRLLRIRPYFHLLLPVTFIPGMVDRLHDILTSTDAKKLGSATQWIIFSIIAGVFLFQIYYSYSMIKMWRLSVYASVPGETGGYSQLIDEDSRLELELEMKYDIKSGWYKTFTFSVVTNYVLHLTVQTAILIITYIMRAISISSANVFRETDQQIWAALIFVTFLAYTLIDNILLNDITYGATLPYVTGLIYASTSTIKFSEEVGYFETASVILCGIMLASVVFKEQWGTYIKSKYDKLKDE